MGVAESEEGGINEDAHFSELLLMNGYKIKIVTSLKCLHVDFKLGKIYGFQDSIDEKIFACFPWINQVEYISLKNLK